MTWPRAAGHRSGTRHRRQSRHPSTRLAWSLGTYWGRVAYGETVPQPYRCLDETRALPGRRLRVGARLAVDVGSVRVGMAHCDGDGRLASPLAMISRGRGDVDA